MTRYLEENEEKTLKAEINNLYQNATSNNNDGLDILMVPYLKRLNRIPGIATEQSCQGHSKTTPEGYLYIDSGCLWIRLSENKYEQFLELADQLYLENDTILITLYIANFNGRHDIIEIHFNGAGKGSIENTMEHITRFFERLT